MLEILADFPSKFGLKDFEIAEINTASKEYND